MPVLTLDHISEFMATRVAPALRKSAAQQEDLKKKLAAAEHELAQYRHQEKLTKIAAMLEDKPPFAGQTLAERLEYVKQASENLKKEGQGLETLETAASMLSRDGGFGKVSEKVGSGDSEANFITAILNGR